MRKPSLFFGRRTSAFMLVRDLATYDDRGVYPYNLYAKTNRYAPAGAGGEAIFTALFLTTTHFYATALYVTAIVDGTALERQKITLPDVAGVRTVTPWEFGLSVPITIGATEVGRCAPRGTWIQVLIETVHTIGGANPAKRLLVEQVEIEHEIVRESKTPSTAVA